MRKLPDNANHYHVMVRDRSGRSLASTTIRQISPEKAISAVMREENKELNERLKEARKESQQ